MLSLSKSLRHFILLTRGSTVYQVFNIGGIAMLQSRYDTKAFLKLILYIGSSCDGKRNVSSFQIAGTAQLPVTYFDLQECHYTLEVTW